MSIAPVVIEFLAKGTPEIARAFRGVEDALGASERRTTGRAASESNKRQREAEREARDKVAAWKRMDREVQRIQDRATRDTARAAQAESRASERAARDKVRAMVRADAEIRRIQDRAVADAERAEAQKARSAERWVRQREAQMRRQRDREIGGRERFGHAIVGAAGAGFRSGVGRVMQLTQQTAGIVTQLGGGFSIADSVNRAAKNSGDLEDILNSAQNPASNIKANHRRREASEVLPGIQSTAVRYGMERSDVQKGLGSFTSITGDFETAQKLMPQLAELARATGSSFDDLSQAAGNAATAFDGLDNAEEKSKKVMQIMRAVAGQGKAGSVEIKDMAVQMGKLVAQAGRFEGDNVDNIVKMGAIAQAARGGGGAWNAASASTAVSAFTATFGKGARLGAFEGAGVKVFADENKTRIRAPEQIIADSISKTGGNIPKMQAMWGSVFSDRAVHKFVDVYGGAEAKTKGSGRGAVVDYFNTLTKGVAMSPETVKDAAGRRTRALDARMASAREEFDRAVEERLIPAIMKLVPVIEQLVPVIVDLHAQALPAFIDLIKTIADFAQKNKDLIHDLAAHPIGTIIAFEVTKSIAAAALGEAIKATITRLIAGAGGGGGGGAGGGGAGGAIGGAAAAAALTYAGAKPIVDSVLNGQTSGQVAAGQYISRLKHGSEADKKAAVAELHQMQAQYTSGSGNAELAKNIASTPANAIYSLITGEKNTSAEGAEKGIKAREILGNEDLLKLVAALDRNTAATQANSRNGGAGGAPGGEGAGGANRSTNIAARNAGGTQ